MTYDDTDYMLCAQMWFVYNQIPHFSFMISDFVRWFRLTATQRCTICNEICACTLFIRIIIIIGHSCVNNSQHIQLQFGRSFWHQQNGLDVLEHVSICDSNVVEGCSAERVHSVHFAGVNCSDWVAVLLFNVRPFCHSHVWNWKINGQDATIVQYVFALLIWVSDWWIQHKHWNRFGQQQQQKCSKHFTARQRMLKKVQTSANKAE